MVTLSADLEAKRREFLSTVTRALERVNVKGYGEWQTAELVLEAITEAGFEIGCPEQVKLPARPEND
jgi:hypothetical protein